MINMLSKANKQLNIGLTLFTLDIWPSGHNEKIITTADFPDYKSCPGPKEAIA